MPRKLGKSEVDFNLIPTPNRILKIVAQFTVYQWRVYSTIIELFENETKKSFEGGQLAIQSFLKQQTIVLSIPLRKISKPSEYRAVKESLVAMSKIECEITYVANGEDRIVTGTLFTLDRGCKVNCVRKRFFTFRHRNEQREIRF